MTYRTAKGDLITRISPKTCDFTWEVREYLRSIGHTNRALGNTPLWTRRENYRVVAWGPTRESVDPDWDPLAPINIDISPDEWVGAA